VKNQNISNGYITAKKNARKIRREYGNVNSLYFPLYISV